MDVLAGNAAHDGSPFRGWFVGHFLPPGPARSTDVEIKWGRHGREESRAVWSSSTTATTMSVLVQGRFRLSFATGEHVLAEPGDYVLWGPGVAHRWRSEADDTIILTVRWPSVAGDVREH